MKYFVNLANMNKYATDSTVLISIFSNTESYVEVNREEFQQLADVF